MKHLLLFLFLILWPLTATNNSQYVYICTGDYSKCYHKTDNCEGLVYCSKEIKKVTKDDAVNKYNRKPCKYCYGNN